jgi:hypothetical protein
MAVQIVAKASTEHDVQVALFDWLRSLPAPNELPGVVADYAWMNPNGLYLGRGTAKQKAAYISKMKRAGFMPGVADLTIAIPRNGLHGCYLELKRDMSWNAMVRSVSETQADHLFRMKMAGYFSGVAAGIDQAVEAVKYYLYRGGLHYNLEAFAEINESGAVLPKQPKRRRPSSDKP